MTQVIRERVPDEIQLARPDELEYKAYYRQFSMGKVLFITATCSYPVGPYEIFFQGAGGVTWKLMEKAPSTFYSLITYYITSTTPGQPLVEMPTTVTVIDGFGIHEVPVNPEC